MSDPNVPFVPARDTVQAHLEPEIRDGSQSRGGHIHTLVSESAREYTEDRNISCVLSTPARSKVCGSILVSISTCSREHARMHLGRGPASPTLLHTFSSPSTTHSSILSHTPGPP